MNLKTVGICTLGCKVNTYESEFVINKLKEKGYIIKDFDEICDIYIINTCTVTNQADIKSRKMIRSAIKKNKEACVVAMGCFIEGNQKFQEEGVSIYLGNKNKSRIIEYIEEYYKKKETIKKQDTSLKTEFEDMYIDTFPGRTRAFVKIQDGCENFCSYCIIPYVRGKCRSKELSTVIKEVKALVANDYKEVVLTGIHTGNYGVDRNENFADLLNELVKIKGLKHLRISSIEITELNNEVLAVLQKSKVIVDHLHIPLQAGSDRVLSLMNRKYDLKYFKEKIKKIREIRPNISITTDIIVGHPEEKDEDFLDTLKTAKELLFSKIHVFPYSIREGTKAATMKQVDIETKKKRARKLLEVSKELEIEYFNKFLGQKIEVLIEKNKENYSYGHTSNYLHIKIKGKYKKNSIIKIQLQEINYPYILGEYVDE